MSQPKDELFSDENESTAASPSGTTPGQILKALREKQSITQAEVAKQLHLSMDVIIDIERDEYRRTPALTYMRGYLRAYAKFIGASEEEILKAFDTLGLKEERAIPQRPNNDRMVMVYAPPHSVTQRIARWGGVVVVIVIIAMVVLWWKDENDRGNLTAQSTSSDRTGRLHQDRNKSINTQLLPPKNNAAETVNAQAPSAAPQAEIPMQKPNASDGGINPIAGSPPTNNPVNLNAASPNDIMPGTPASNNLPNNQGTNNNAGNNQGYNAGNNQPGNNQGYNPGNSGNNPVNNSMNNPGSNNGNTLNNPGSPGNPAVNSLNTGLLPNGVQVTPGSTDQANPANPDATTPNTPRRKKRRHHYYYNRYYNRWSENDVPDGSSDTAEDTSQKQPVVSQYESMKPSYRLEPAHD